MSEMAYLSFAYAKSGYEQSRLSFSYAKSVSAIESASLTFSYSKDSTDVDEWERTITPVSYMTQMIGNEYQYWHAARVKVGGRTQRVINSLQAHALDGVMKQVRRYRANRYLRTVDVSEPYRVWAISRPVAVGDEKKTLNLLQNPGLSEVQTYRYGPRAWDAGFQASTGTVKMVPGVGLFGYYAVRLTADVDEYVSLEQKNDLVFRKNAPFTVTVWYAGMRADQEREYLSDGPRLLVTMVYRDGTSEVIQKYLRDDTDGEWVSDTKTITPNEETHSVSVAVIVSPRGGEKCVLDVGGVQLERGSSSSVWTENILSRGLLYLVSPAESVTEDAGAGTVTYRRRQVVCIDDSNSYEDLVMTMLPNRCFIDDPDDETAVSSFRLGVHVDEAGKQYQVGWRISGGLIERYNASLGMNEVFHTFALADYHGYGVEEPKYRKPSEIGVTMTLETLTIVDGLLYVVVKETWKGVTNRLLKICSPGYRWDDKEHLEVLADIYMDDGTGTCTAIGQVDQRKDLFLVDVNGSTKRMELIWDVAARDQRGIVLMRSDPGDGVLVA